MTPAFPGEAIVAAILAVPQTSSACACQPAPKVDPAKVKKSIEWLLTNRTNVLRVRALRRVSDKDFSFEFAVIESWKGDYQPGDAIVASSIAFVDCREAVAIGDDLVVSFNELAKANFAKDACPDRFQERRRELEAEYLKKLSPKYRPPGQACCRARRNEPPRASTNQSNKPQSAFTAST